MEALISIPVLGILVMLQIAVFSNLQILFGNADVVFLAIIGWALQNKVKNGWVWALVGGGMISLVTAMPFFAYLFGYLGVALLAQFIKKRIWQIPVLAMFFLTGVGTILVQFFSLGILQFLGTRLEWMESINLVILPSTLLNLILALPVYLLMSDLANWVYPSETEE